MTKNTDQRASADKIPENRSSAVPASARQAELQSLARDLLLILFGSLLFSASMNLLIVPAGMYNGGFLGIAQLIRILGADLLSALPIKGDLSGYIYFLLNIPLLLFSWHRFGRLFFGKTVFCVVCYSILLAVIPVLPAPLLDDEISLCLLGGLACGTGAAITLIAGCSGGGEEILGLLLSQKDPKFSVGRFSLLLNVFVYGVGFLCFDYRVVIYSIIFSAITFLTLDRVHLQNVMMTMTIITKMPDLEQVVFDCVHRGVTVWDGRGGYSSEHSQVLMTVVSKKESIVLRELLKQHDPNVFIICNEDVSVTGNFQKRI